MPLTRITKFDHHAKSSAYGNDRFVVCAEERTDGGKALAVGFERPLIRSGARHGVRERSEPATAAMVISTA